MISTAKYKRHTKKLLNHPLQLHFVPLIISAVVVLHIVSLTILLVGFRAGEIIRPIIPSTSLPQNTFPVYNTQTELDEQLNEELLQMDETDEELNNQINDLLYNLDNSDSVVAQTYKNSEVLGASSNNVNTYPVEQKMYNPEDLQNSLTNDKDLGINVVSVDKTFASIFSNYTQVLLPILCLALAVLGVNYLEDKTLLTKKHHQKKSHKK